MDHWMARGTIFYAVMVTTLAVLGVPGIRAQTLTEPNSKPELSQPSGPAKSERAKRAKSCGNFGAGFVQIAGTDMCVKIGGYISTEGTVNRAR
jgi:Porin subfamily